jgi:hypothetical protein
MNTISNEYLDQHRWLINNGLFTDNTKDTLFMYGSIVNKLITAVELSVDSDTKHISYVLYAAPSLIKAYNKYHELKLSSSLWAMWRIKRLLSRNGNLEFQQIISAFVKTYCGPGWTASMQLKASSDYEEQRSKANDDKGKN